MTILEITIGHSAPPTSLWTTILTGLAVALGGGIVLFLLNWLREVVMARWNKRAEAEVLAFSLATELDRLISECWDVMHDPQHEDRETGIWEATVATPTISFSDQPKWASFPKRLHYRIRALPNKIDAAVRSCANIGEYGEGPPYYGDYFQEREIRFAWIGLESCLLRQELTDKYGVEVLERGQWEPEANFRTKIMQIEQQRQTDKVAWQPPDFLRPKVDIADLEKRRADLGVALDAAQERMARAPQWM